MLYITGDTHANFTRLSKHNGFEAGIGDFVIICGDFGGIWDNSPREKWWLKWLSQKPFNTLFVDGNHENFSQLNAYPVELWNGGKVHKIRENVLHLMRGQIFNIAGKSIFTFGGAESHDKLYRIEGLTWWKEEMPTESEMQEGTSNLEKHGPVDLIITHCAPTSILKSINRGEYSKDVLTDYLENIADSNMFEHWYFGHYHDNLEIDTKFSLVYDSIHKINAGMVER